MSGREANGRTGASGPGTGDTTRRDFLKVIGVAGAGAAAACGPPDTGDKLIPYLVQPDEIIPGTNTPYATVLTGAGEPLPVHAMVRDGRAIKLEGNPDFPGGTGRLSALAHSSLQDLYDPDRISGPRRREGEVLSAATWDDAIAAAAAAVSAAGPGGTALLTAPATGARLAFYARWAAAVGAEHVAYEPFGLEAMRAAHEIAFGIAAIPSYELDRADRIVSFGADFLETWLAPVDLAGRFARARDVEAGRHARFTFVGPRLSLTGTNADDWLPARPGTEGHVALAVAHVVAERRGGAAAARVAGLLADYSPEAVAGAADIPAERIRQLGEEVAEARAPIALPPGVAGQGAASTGAHLAVAILNAVSGAVGETVRFDRGPARGTSASFAEIRNLVGRLRDGSVRTLIVAGPNPAYSLPHSVGFADALENVTVLSLASHLDETAALADWILPASHELESWGDADIAPGVRALAQPVMRPVFDTRQQEDILLAIAKGAGAETAFETDDFAAFLKSEWKDRSEAGSDAAFEDWWREALKRGGSGEAEAGGAAAPPLSAAAASHDFGPPASPDGITFVAAPTLQFHDGRGANRSWMQEFPDAVTKAVWNAWVEIHPETAAPLGLSNGDLVEVRSAAGSVRAPAYLYRGIRPDVVAIPLGQGHAESGRTAKGRGVNALDLLDGTADARSGALSFAAAGVQISAVGERARLVIMQGSDSDHGREFAEMLGVAEAHAAIREHRVDLRELVEAAYDSDPKSPYRWGMTIDLNACTGCGACVTACYAENNLPTVGEDLCAMGREMSWMQIERYYEETPDGFQTVHEPMLCQHCGDAPCEPVCPVYAAYHTPEGLNGQVYNRCVGTRYCANNCPYKVRRFNWYTYEPPAPLTHQLNPDVTVRQKGVMEKCTFCVQRINRAKIQAKEEGRLVQDGEIRTACMQSCPTDAIVFGNLKDPESRVSRIAKGARAYHVLGELNTRPAVTYLKSVTHAALPAGEGHGHGGRETHGDG
ncbi:MAG: molybdopterin dinucleotide binding domain-containing protein [Gemmatimonadota bacterium]